MRRPRRRSGDEPAWRVRWQDWGAVHNWIGGRRTKKKQPPTEVREFATEAAALAFRDELVKSHGRDSVVVRVSSLRELLPPALKQDNFSRDWPRQRKGDRSW